MRPLLLIAAALLLALAITPARTHAGSTARRRGAELFSVHGCAHCHGFDGVNGDRGPDLQLVRKRLTAAQIRAQIVHGGEGMPAFGDQLTTPEIDDLLAYLRAKRKVIVPPPPPPPAVKPDPDAP